MNDRIALLIPTRKRPDRLARALRSIEALASRPQQVVAVVGVDDDDQETLDAPWPALRAVEVRRIIGPRMLTLGHLWNKLARNAEDCDILALSTDDVVMASQGWDAEYRAATACMPKGYGVAFPRDPVHPGMCTFPIVTRALVQKLGFFVPPWFPFWFHDTWLDEVGILMACRLPLAARIECPEGKGLTLGMRDIPFWAHFMESLRFLRVKAADEILGELYADNPALLISLRQNLRILPAYLSARMTGLHDPVRTAHLHATQADGEPDPRYLEARNQAEALLTSLSLPLSRS
jgi:hypothetical protein